MQCPSCHKEVTAKDKDYGALFTCPQCRSVYFLNFDGTPEFGEVVQPTAEELAKLTSAGNPEKKKGKKKKDKDEEEIAQHEVAAHLSPDQTSVEPMHNPLLEAASEPIPEAVEEIPQPPQPEDFSLEQTPAMEEIPPMQEAPSVDTVIESFSLQAEPEPEPEPESQMMTEVSVAEPEPESEPISEPAYQYEEPQAMTEIVMSETEAEEPMGLPQDFRDIASEIENFGNQQTVVAGLTYDLEISGLDTKESQELLKEAIEDSRFAWHADDYIREIKSGTCRFKDLTPVQAFVLARRIQFIDVDMKWKQNVIA